MKALPHNLNSPLIHAIVVMIIGIAVYSNTLYSPFMFDDEANIIENPIIKDFVYFKDNTKVYGSTALSGIKDFFRSRYVGYLSFAINYRLHGLDVLGYHVVNIAIHIINALFVYWLIMLSSKTPFLKSSIFDVNNNRKLGGIIALFSSLLFVAHPIQTQAVTYIVQRFTSLATLFYLFSLILYIRSRLEESTAKRYGFYVASLISAVLAMKTKEISFTLPVIVAIYEFMFFEGKLKKRLFYLIPIILTMLIIPLTFITNNFSGSKNIEEVFKIANISQWDYLFTQFRVIVTYIRLMFPPVIQNLDYDYPVYHSFFELPVFLSFVLLLSILGLGIYLFYRSRLASHVLRLIAFGIFWFFITLSVESTIIPRPDVIFEQRMYLPSIGFLMAAVTALMMTRIPLQSKFAVLGKAVMPTVAAIVFIFAGGAYARNTIWQDEIKLWENVVRKSYGNARPHTNLGKSYLIKGRIEEAIREFKIALQINPDMQEAHLNLGLAYIRQGFFDKAIEEFLLVLKRNPYYHKAHINIGIAYFELNRFDDAARSFKNATKINPDLAKGYYNLGLTYEKQGNTDSAIKEYKIAMKLDPDMIIMYNNLGVNYFQEGKLDDAIRSYQILIELRPDFVQAHYNLGLAYKGQKRYDEAIQEFEAALKLKPDDVTMKNIGTYLNELKKLSP
ncbi:MAG: tetratricopeptide repeat protein [Nitrospirae bacterium]|nr:tetratricopeptide repeat protein [Nitrospirota bacterium]MCL5978084.1 tetratricopeptide repeat protein [Nitrospirota bacterium]